MAKKLEFVKRKLPTTTGTCVLKIEQGLVDNPVIQGVDNVIEMLDNLPDYIGSITVFREGLPKQKSALGDCLWQDGQYKVPIRIFAGPIVTFCGDNVARIERLSFRTVLHEIGHANHLFERSLGFRMEEKPSRQLEEKYAEVVADDFVTRIHLDYKDRKPENMPKTGKELLKQRGGNNMAQNNSNDLYKFINGFR